MNAAKNDSPTPRGQEKLSTEQVAKNLANFAIDRTDLKELILALPQETSLNKTTLEYELGILKILSVGWGIAFYMAATDKNKPALTESYWAMIQEISQNISTLTQTTTGTQVDYFGILKQRLDSYVELMQTNPSQATEPTAVMGPAFAQACKCPNDPMAILTGTKMFTLTLGAVKEYLAAVNIKEITIH
ncbi:MAG: hypothetical protein HUK40_20245 [Desulfobacter sp.]|nr:hypothetical protein [Desulfobacter sp.]WDP86249.1 MAG: hypothetical protein HUN05_14860 [Desulfobacter sp.]